MNPFQERTTMPTSQHDPQLGYMPAIPEPFWFRGWRTWFRYRPACYRCAEGGKPKLFADLGAYRLHYVLKHMGDDDAKD
jgi:hypothetical protein